MGFLNHAACHWIANLNRSTAQNEVYWSIYNHIFSFKELANGFQEMVAMGLTYVTLEVIL